MMDTAKSNGNGFNEHSFALAHARMVSAPLALTDDDFTQLKSVHPSLATQAHQLRAIAKRVSSRAVTRPPAARQTKHHAALPVVSYLEPTAAIDALDRKAGRIHTIEDWRALSKKSAAVYTDDDITLIRYFDGEPRAADARARRAKALAPWDPPKALTETPTTNGAAAAAAVALSKPVTKSVLGKYLDSYTTAVATVLKELFAKRDTRIADLEARLKTMEARPELKYCGIWRPDGKYSECSLATYSGSLWLATKSTPLGKPGTADSGWRLIVKSGAAGQ